MSEKWRGARSLYEGFQDWKLRSCDCIDQYIREPLKHRGLAVGLSLQDLTLALVASDDKQTEVLAETSRDQMENSTAMGTMETLRHMRGEIRNRVPGTCVAVDSRYLCYARLTIADPIPDDLSSWVINGISDLIPQGLDPHQIVIDFRVIAGLKRKHVQVVWGVHERLERLADSLMECGFPVMTFYPASIAVVQRDNEGGRDVAPVLYLHSRYILLLTYVDGVVDVCSELGEFCMEDATWLSSLCDQIKALLPEHTRLINVQSAISLPATFKSRFRQVGLEVEIEVAVSLAYGAALQGLHLPDRPFVLLSGQTPNGRQTDRDRLTAFRMAICGILALSLLYGLLLSASNVCEYWLDNLAGPIHVKRSAIAISDSDTNSERRSHAVLASARKTNESLIRLLDSLGSTVPDSLWLSSLTLTRGSARYDFRGNMSGTTSNEIYMLDLIERLRSSNLWQIGGALRAERSGLGAGFGRERAIGASVSFEIDLTGGIP